MRAGKVVRADEGARGEAGAMVVVVRAAVVGWAAGARAVVAGARAMAVAKAAVAKAAAARAEAARATAMVAVRVEARAAAKAAGQRAEATTVGRDTNPARGGRERRK